MTSRSSLLPSHSLFIDFLSSTFSPCYNFFSFPLSPSFHIPFITHSTFSLLLHPPFSLFPPSHIPSSSLSSFFLNPLFLLTFHPPHVPSSFFFSLLLPVLYSSLFFRIFLATLYSSPLPQAPPHTFLTGRGGTLGHYLKPNYMDPTPGGSLSPPPRSAPHLHPDSFIFLPRSSHHASAPILCSTPPP